MPAIKINVYLSWCTELAFFVNTYHTCGRAYIGRPTIHEVDSTLDGGEDTFIEETHVKEKKCDGKAAGKLTTTEVIGIGKIIELWIMSDNIFTVSLGLRDRNGKRFGRSDEQDTLEM